MSDECPLVELNGFSMYTDEIQYCPFCGGSATPSDVGTTGVGHATCDTCDETFWVEL